ncbi:thiamine pyrophosphate-dependent enzyme [Pseudonocardia nigra]|uniref:thiamine pyrophosphate-dependent enzyme n=1 Tax=Pseudonocardia nigra TaxID=1921578 RepID=UPI0027E23949|nr:thiamine pyrophosphate-dependent enzyme [Pseudonocardia nigra]
MRCRRPFHRATLPPAGPVFVSLPLDDWARPVDPDEVGLLPARRVRWAGAADPDLVAELAGRLGAARTPALVVGPEADDERAFPSWSSWPSGCGPRCGRPRRRRAARSPTTHPLWQGVLPPSIAGVREHLDGHDLVLVLGAAVFRYHAYRPGPWLPEGTALVAVSSDPGSAARAAFGDAVVGDVAAIVPQLLAALTPADRPQPAVRRQPDAPAADAAPISADALFATMARVLPADVRLVNESTANTTQFWAHLPIRHPRSLFFPAAGGLGFGLPAAVGVALADPGRPVVAVLGDGAVQYGVPGLSTAVQLGLPVTFVVLRNGGYGALRSFVAQLGVADPPGLDLPGLDAVRIAEGYGMPATRIRDGAELAAALACTASTEGPRLLEVPVVTETRPLG